MRWLSERSGAADGLEVMVEDIGPVAVGMGGESTHPRAPFKAKPRIHMKLKLSFRYVEDGGWCVAVCRDFRLRTCTLTGN